MTEKRSKYYDTYIGMLLSHKCNLNCRYCYIPVKKDIVLSLETAQQILTGYLEQGDAEEIEIDFMGAEPLTAFDRMKEIVEWTKEQHFPRDCFFFATTNGTLLNDEMKEWFRQNKDIIILGLSYDGTDSSQDCNRSGSSEKIDIGFFLQTWPDQVFKCTITQQSVGELADGIIRLAEMGAGVTANPAYEKDEWSEQSIRIYADQLRKIVDYYTDHPDAPAASLVDHDLVGIYSRRNSEQGPNCGATKGEGIYDTTGHSYPCHMLSPLVMDEEKALEIQQMVKNADPSAYKDKKCADCILRNDCPTCMATNYLARHDFGLRDTTHCILTRLEVLATCVLQKNRLLSKSEHDTSDMQMAASICEIYRRVRGSAFT